MLKELDGLKLSSNSETAFKARRAAVVISKNLERIIFNPEMENENMKVDDKLLKLAAKYNGILITNDVYLKVKCLISKVGTNENQYIIVRDLATKEILSIVQNRNGEIKEVIPYEITNGWINKIYPRNPEQRCLFNILQQKDISIVYAGGQFGTGKSFILNNYAIS